MSEQEIRQAQLTIINSRLKFLLQALCVFTVLMLICMGMLYLHIIEINATVLELQQQLATPVLKQSG